MKINTNLSTNSLKIIANNKGLTSRKSLTTRSRSFTVMKRVRMIRLQNEDCRCRRKMDAWESHSGRFLHDSFLLEFPKHAFSRADRNSNVVASVGGEGVEFPRRSDLDKDKQIGGKAGPLSSLPEKR